MLKALQKAVLCSCLLCAFAQSAPFAEENAMPFSFEDPTVRIPPGAPSGVAEITLRSSADQKTPSNPDDFVKDFELPHQLAATVSFKLINHPQPGIWRLQVLATGLSRANTTEQHYAEVSYGDPLKTQVIPYLVTNTAASFSWLVSKLPDPWVASSWVSGPVCTEFMVIPKDSPATNVGLVSTLVEQTSKEGISAGKLRLCLLDGGRCESQQAIDLPANLPSQLQICTTAGFRGNFHGAVTLTSAQKPDGDVILQSASFSTFLAKCCGFLLLCVGVYLAWWSKVWARARLERDQALMPAVLMRAQLAALQQVLAALPTRYRSVPSNISKAIRGLLGDLDDSMLDKQQFLPPTFPNPYGYSVDAAGYKAYLEARNPAIQLLAVLLRQGVVPARTEDNGTFNEAQQAVVEEAIRNIDAIWVTNPQPTAGQALQTIQPILIALHNSLFPQAPGAVVPAAAQPLSPTIELQTLELQIESISKGVWLLYGVLTAISGLAVLILNNQGFGVPLDFVFAFFWGFGLPTTIGALAPGSAASALSISVATS